MKASEYRPLARVLSTPTVGADRLISCWLVKKNKGPFEEMEMPESQNRVLSSVCT